MSRIDTRRVVARVLYNLARGRPPPIKHRPHGSVTVRVLSILAIQRGTSQVRVAVAGGGPLKFPALVPLTYIGLREYAPGGTLDVAHLITRDWVVCVSHVMLLSVGYSRRYHTRMNMSSAGRGRLGSRVKTFLSGH